MILTLTPNPALDVTYGIDHLELGASHRVRSVVERAGGKGINVASVLRTLGHDATVHGPVGGVVGEQLRADLRERSIRDELTPVGATTRRTVTLVADDGGATVLNEPGHLSVEEWRTVLSHLRASVQDAEVVVASGSLPAGVPETAYAEICAIARDHGVPCIVDTSGPALLAALDGRPDLVKPNHHELREVTGHTDPVAGARELQRRGARAVVVSRGEDGMLLLGADGTVRTAKTREPLQGNPTGAGDAAVAALAAGLVEGVDHARLVQRAVAWSASAVTQPVAGEIDLGLADRLMNDLIEGDA